VQLQARVAPWPSRLADLGAESAGVIRQNLDRSTHAAAIGVALRPMSLVQLQPEAGPDGLLRDWPVPALDVHKHYGYAAQWFTFCAMIAGLYVWFQLIRPRRLARRG
jgi:surfeit locus 1 family protein